MMTHIYNAIIRPHWVNYTLITRPQWVQLYTQYSPTILLLSLSKYFFHICRAFSGALKRKHNISFPWQGSEALLIAQNKIIPATYRYTRSVTFTGVVTVVCMEYSTVPLKHIFLPNHHNSLPSWVSYGVSFVTTDSYLYSAPVTVIQYNVVMNRIKMTLDCISLPSLLLGQNYSVQTKMKIWLLMPWLLASPGHQQQWYWQSMKQWNQYKAATKFSGLSRQVVFHDG